LCKSLVDSIEEARFNFSMLWLIITVAARAIARGNSALSAPLWELRKAASSTQLAIDRLRAPSRGTEPAESALRILA
jgi:hypothetical protein